MIRFDLNMEHDEVYGKFVLTVCICSILYFFNFTQEAQARFARARLSQAGAGKSSLGPCGFSPRNFRNLACEQAIKTRTSTKMRDVLCSRDKQLYSYYLLRILA